MANHRARSAGVACWRRLVVPLTSAVLVVAFLLTAWVSEDALITFRTIDNWVNGYGLRFNVDERVQTYTDPLWMLLNAAPYFVTREIYWTTTIIGIACSLGAYGTLAWQLRARPFVVVSALCAPWLLARCLLRYSTSGFESPLTLLLVALFCTSLLRWDRAARPPWLSLSLLAALAATNRLDTILLFLPALAWLVLAERRRLALRRLLLGASPLLAWLSFSLVYYGFLLPNTAPAKLSADIPLSTYLGFGVLYLLDLVQNDLAAAGLLAAGLAVAGHAAWRIASRRGEVLDGKLTALGAGALLYELYVIRIGGGFLSGRFFAAPVLVAMVLLAARLDALLRAKWRPTLRQGSALAVAVGSVLLGLYALGRTTRVATADAAILPLPVAYASLGADARWHETDWARRFQLRGIHARELARRGQRVNVEFALGFAGIAAGPDVLLIDPYALADPLLARLPPAEGLRFRAGHVPRELPEGYEYARETGSLERMSPGLRRYYERLRLVTAGPIWRAERFAAIAGFLFSRPPPPTAANER